MKITPGISEIVGIYIGDGHIHRERNKFQIGFTGNPRTDIELFEKLKKLIKEEFGKEVTFKVRGNGLRMVFRSKEISNILINELGLTYGRGKSERVTIPDQIINDQDLAKYAVRGIMDTDGTVFVSKKPRVEKYPTMEITTTSSILAGQLREILLKKGFRVGNIRKSISKLGKLPAYRVPLYGKENIRKWLREIGFSNVYKKNRAESYIQYSPNNLNLSDKS
ncbi:MAG: LAGLIDADG family homing endonuclease [Nanoarchaeota archaeon]